MNTLWWIPISITAYIVISVAVGRVLRNINIRYADYPKEQIDGNGFAWPAMILLYTFVGILNVLTVAAEWLIVRPVSYIVDRFVPNNETIKKWDER